MRINGVSARGKDLLSLALIIFVAFLVYGNAIRGGFILEDLDFIVKNQFVKSWRYLPQIFSLEVGAGSGTNNYTYYRPMHIFSYLIEYSLWGLAVEGYHLVNIFLHGLIGFLIYRLIFILAGNRVLSLWTALLFLVHPIHNSAVAHIAGRENLLGAFFLLSSFLIYIRTCTVNAGWLYPILGLTWAMALLSKENNIMFPFLLMVYHYAYKVRIRPAAGLVIIGILGLYFGLRAWLLTSVPLKTFDWTSVLRSIPGAFVAFVNYLHLLISPTRIHTIYENDVFSFHDPRSILGLGLALAILLYIYRKRHEKRGLLFAVLWFFILYLPVSNLYPLNAYMGEHRIYLASAAYSLVVAGILYRFYIKTATRRAAGVIFIFLLANSALVTFVAQRHWSSYETFVEDNFKARPQSPITLNAYGCLKYRQNKYIEAIGLFVRAIKAKPDYVDAYVNLGVALRVVGDHSNAIRILERAVTLAPSKASAFHNLGTVYVDRGQYGQAEQLFLRAAELNPQEKSTYFNLAAVAVGSGEFEKAAGWYRKVLELDPGDAKARDQLRIINLQR